MTDNKIVEELFAAKAHLGHKKNRVHPKAKKYIYTVDNGVSIIDLAKTAESLEKAVEFLKNKKTEGQTVLFVATKKVAAAFTQNLASKLNIPYITYKWPAGLLTNFETIAKNIKKLRDMKVARDAGEWTKFVKHEQIKLGKEIIKLERQYSGVVNLNKKPDAVFVVDVKKEKNAVSEAHKSNIPVVAICDTNIDPTTITYPIPANDDSQSSVEYILQYIMDSAFTK